MLGLWEPKDAHHFVGVMQKLDGEFEYNLWLKTPVRWISWQVNKTKGLHGWLEGAYHASELIKYFNTNLPQLEKFKAGFGNHLPQISCPGAAWGEISAHKIL